MIDKSKFTINELRNYRRQIIRQAASFEKPDRIPHMSFYISWPVLDAGYKFSQALYDWDLMEKVMVEHEQKYDFDAVQCLGTRNPMKITEALGVQKYIIDDENDFMNIQDEVYIEHDELYDLAENPIKAYWEKIMPHKYPLFKPGIGKEPFVKAYNEQKAFMDYTVRINERFVNELGVPAHSSPMCGYLSTGAEQVFGMRGIKGFSISLRRDINAVKAACDAIDTSGFEYTMNTLRNSPEGPDPKTSLDALVNTLVNTVVSNKQFEKLVWNDRIKPYLDLMVEKGKQMRIYMHGPLDRFYDYYQDYPKGSLVFMSESNDVFEVKKNLPNAAICGGLTTLMMGHAGTQECIARTKLLIDELGSQGGLILCINTMGMYRQDTKADNLKAVSEFIQTYQA